MPKVSVIVPVYGVEKYIERCARSLFEQTLDDMEFIFIDDCTLDQSISILQRVLNDYPLRIPQTKIERMPQNSGLAAVRKYGVSIASGDYLIACDSDDFVEKEMYQSMYQLAIDKDLDLVQCDIDLVDDEGVVYTLTTPIKNTSSQLLKNMIIDGDIAASLCNKLVKRSIYLSEEISFPVAGMDEDNTMSCQLAFLSKRLGYIQQSFYKAYFNRESMSRIPGKGQVLKRYQDALDNSKIAIGFLTSHGYDDNSIAIIKAKIRPKNALWPILNNNQHIKLWKETYPEINYRALFNLKVPLRIKVKFLLVLSNLVLLRN